MKIKVFCENIEQTIEAEMGTSLLELCNSIGLNTSHPILAAYVNNKIKELRYRVYIPISIRFIDITQAEGYRVYQRTLAFIAQAAIAELYPNQSFHIRHSLGDGVYCEVDGVEQFSEAECVGIFHTMERIISANLPISREKAPTAEVIAQFSKHGFEDKITLLNTRPHLYSDIYRMGGMVGYFFGALAPATGYTPIFDIKQYYKGFFLALPQRHEPDLVATTPHLEKMFDIFREYQTWVDIMGVPTVGSLNAKVLAGDSAELIRTAEAFHENKLSEIAHTIATANKERGVKTVLISGPSSSGKTTTAKRLGVQLRVLGLHPVLVSLDDYFVDREKTPKDENGEYDYEALEALDIPTLNDHLRRLLAGESVAIPRYDFITGTRKWHDSPLCLDDRSILILEGIHGLNPRLTPVIPDAMKFRIYVSCFTSVAMDSVTHIATTDNRLLRRITRDYYNRGNNAIATISRWPSVRRGEERHIFPYQENADVMFNSSLFYEISVLRPIVEPILREVSDAVPEYGEAARMLRFLDNFVPIKATDIPPTSILREFVGGSSFKY